MIVVRIIMKVLPEKHKEVMQTLLSINSPMGIELPEEENDYPVYDIFCDIENKNIFNLISEWETRRYLDDHLKSDRFGVLLGTKSLLCEPLEIRILTVSDSEGMEAVKSARKKSKIRQNKEKRSRLI